MRKSANINGGFDMFKTTKRIVSLILAVLMMSSVIFMAVSCKKNNDEKDTEVCCHFCDKRYIFTQNDLKKIILKKVEKN